MTYVDPLYPDEVDDTEPTAPDLTVEYVEPNVVATLYGVDGTPLLELTDKQAAGYR